MNTTNYQSQTYPTLTQLIVISSADYLKLRTLMIAQNELEKFIKWQRSKYIRITR